MAPLLSSPHQSEPVVPSGSAMTALPSARQVLAGMFVGLIGGVVAFRWPSSGWDHVISMLEPLGAIWLAALQMLTLPLMVSMLITTIGRAGAGETSRLGAWTLLWCLGFLAVAATATVLIGQLVLQWFPVDVATRVAFQSAVGSATTSLPPAATPTVRDWFVNLVPTNLVRSAAGGDLLPLIVATMLFSVALRAVPEARRALLLDLSQAVSEWCFALAGLMFRVLPFSVFVLTLTSTARSGASLASGLAYYVAMISAFLAVGTLILYPITAWLGRMDVARFATAIWPVQLLAFSTRSSVACLPAMIDAARRRLHLPDEVAGFTLPFAVSTFKLNMAISANFQLLFLLHLYGVQPDPVALIVGVVALTLQSFATPGLPSGAIWTTTPVYLALGIPLEGVVLTNVVDTIPDLFKTIANVTGDMSITAIVARHSRRARATA